MQRRSFLNLLGTLVMLFVQGKCLFAVAQSEPPKVTVCEVAKKPDQFDNQIVELKATLAGVIDAFLAQRAPGQLILYLHDIGGPVGMRIATAHPERIAGLIFQNFTMTVEGWNPDRLEVYKRLGGPETPEKLAETEQFATVERGMFLHKKGAHQPDAINPDNWVIDAYAFSNAASRAFMSRLFMNLTTNIEHYPEWTAYLKERQPKTLIVWGRNDPLIWPPAAEFVKRVVPSADLRYFDGGHFVLDEYADAIADAIIETFSG